MNRKFASIRILMSPFLVSALLAVSLPMTGVDAQEQELRPGLVGLYLAGEDTATRVDTRLQFPWGAASPDARIPRGHFRARWSGVLLVPDDGRHRFYVRVWGSVRLLIDGKALVEGEHDKIGWLPPAEVNLRYGNHKIEIEFESQSRGADIGVYWESDAFPLEPLGDGSLFHIVEDPTSGAALSRFAAGEGLIRRLACGACHEIPGIPRPPMAPSLVYAGKELRTDSVQRRLRRSGAAHLGSRMPEFALSAADAKSVTAYLHAQAKSTPTSTTKTSQRRRREEPNAAHGRRLVKELGCLACHTLERVGLGARHAGGPLDGAGSRRTRAGLRRWLSPNPQDPNSVHRPAFALEEIEREHLLAFFQPEEAAVEQLEADIDEIAHGRELVARHRCGACHVLPEKIAVTPAPVLRGMGIRWDRGCFESQPTVEGRPRFWIGEDERAAVTQYVQDVSAKAERSPLLEGAALVHELRCFACHRRDRSLGLESISQEVIAGEESLRGLAGALRPPSLASIGDKFPSGRLSEVLRGEAGRRRTWLRVRMPGFQHLSAESIAAIEHYFVASDRIEDSTPSDASLPTSGELYSAGHQLVGGQGFSCTSCHDVGDYRPSGVEPNVRGPDLVGLSRWSRKGWFLRWMRDPSRRIPGVEMPAIPPGTSPLLAGRLDHQMEALWFSLNSPKFSTPPAAGVVRAVGVDGERAVIVRDVFRHRPPYGEGWTPRALAVGLPVGQHVLYDVDGLAPRAWWAGEFASEFTQGKTWLWEPTGVPVLPSMPVLPSITLASAAGGHRFAVGDGQTVGRLRHWRHRPDAAVEVAYDLRFPAGDGIDSVSLLVRETIRGLPAVNGLGGGWSRRLVVETSELEAQPFFASAFEPEGALIIADAKVAFTSSVGEVRVAGPKGASWRALDSIASTVVSTWPARLVESLQAARVYVHPLEQRADKRWETTVVYRSPPTVTRAQRVVVPPMPARKHVEFDGVPGFEAVQLPLPPTIMPTAFAFLPDGTTVVTSLRGEVVRLLDRDGDGIEEAAERVADYFAAPFGVVAEENNLVVSQKPELVRLRDSTGDGFFDVAQVVSTGWGYSHDYHDWLFGLVSADSSYYALFASNYNQAGRSRETSRLRGKAVRFTDSGDVEVVARGLRYPVGIAKNRDGEVFFTDNQGVGNTFNEINHLRAGKIYGVPSLYDPEEDRKAPSEPPVVRIPHPWMRSVNGIGFLDAGGMFGPYEGHGIACEYDHRALVRFSLQRVGDTYQGACYPLSQLTGDGKGQFLGPLSCAIRSDGTLYIGNIRDSGWGGGNNIGSVVRLRLSKVPFGIREVRAFAHGFEIDFTGAVDGALAAELDRYEISGYRRIWQGQYSTPDSDRHQLQIQSVEVLGAKRRVRVHVRQLRLGFLYEIHVRSLRGNQDEDDMWPRVAYYTLNVIPHE